MSFRLRGPVQLVNSKSDPFTVIRFNREATTYDPETGIAISSPEEVEIINAYVEQPIVNDFTDGPEAQREVDTRTGYSTEFIRNKDKIIIPEKIDGYEEKCIIYTVSDIKLHGDGVIREFKLTRSGEADNIY